MYLIPPTFLSGHNGKCYVHFAKIFLIKKIFLNPQGHYHYSPTKTAKLKRPTKPSVGENVEQLELLVECKLVKIILENHLAISTEVNGWGSLIAQLVKNLPAI